MAEVVDAPPKGLELYAPTRRRTPLTGGGKQASGLEKLEISSVQDLLQHYPRYHIDRTQLRTIKDLRALAASDDGVDIQVHATVEVIGRPVALKKPTKTGKKRTMIKAKIKDETGRIEVTWFNQDWVLRVLKPGVVAFFYGKVSTFRGSLQMTAPRFEVVKTGREPFNVGRIVPIYPATSDLSTDGLRKIMWDTLKGAGEIMDPLPTGIRTQLGYMTRGDALSSIHFPDTKEDVLKARRRIVFDELFSLQLGLVYRKKHLERTVEGIAHPAPDKNSLPEVFVDALPFSLTGAQRRACDEVVGDMTKHYPMHRLIEGEVGSGKTVVALYACLLAISGGNQAALMAPTEVLAEQHHLTVKELLDRAFGEHEGAGLFADTSLRPVVRLLTGSTTAAAREEILRDVAMGQVDLLIGTHALIQDAVEFARLGVAVVDEQHRFGVHQRRTLRDKGTMGEPDILVMTATPIPRTLAVTIYGDLDISILDELPAGRMPIETRIAFGDDDREAAYAQIREEVATGRQAFIVYALRDESDKTELRSAKAEAKRLAADVFPDLTVGLVHGDMKSADKEKAMNAFRDGSTQVLVATTVIEVGVDIPNATVMLIEDAERFGLAQLHQLRGRIGRGGFTSYCILATDIDPSGTEDVAMAMERLEAVAGSTDGFDLALVDLRHRGEGQLFGPRQSGMPQLKLARVLEHQDVIKQARDLAVRLLDEDPELGCLRAHRPAARDARSLRGCCPRCHPVGVVDLEQHLATRYLCSYARHSRYSQRPSTQVAKRRNPSYDGPDEGISILGAG